MKIAFVLFGFFFFAQFAQSEPILKVEPNKIQITVELKVPQQKPEEKTKTKWPGEQKGERIVYLSDLNPTVDKTFKGHQIKLTAKGKLSEHGIYAHPIRTPGASVLAPSSSQLIYNLNGEYDWLTGWVGITDKSPLDTVDAPYSAVTFKIIADGDVLWKSVPMQKRGEAFQFRVDLTNANVLELIVECPGRFEFCNAFWFEPKIYSSGKPFNPAFAEKEIRRLLPKATEVECVALAQRALKIVKYSDNRTIVLSAKRLALSAARKTNNNQFVDEVTAALKKE